MRPQNTNPIVTYPTPDLRDKLFYETRRSDVAANRTFVYGEAHPNPVKFSGYKLVYVSPAPTADEPDAQRWWYAADRQEQEVHAALVSYPYFGLPNCPRFDYSLVLFTADYSPLAKGTAHPLDEGDDTLPEHEQFIGAKLVYEQEIALPDELSSIYTGVRRVYDRVPPLSEQLDHNIETSYPYAGLASCPRYTRTLIVPRDEYTALAKGTADPTYPSAKLIDEAQLETNDQIISAIYLGVRRVYDLVPSIAAQEAYNAEKDFPYQADRRFPRTTRKYVVPRADVATAVIPSASLDLEGATLAFRVERRIEGQAEDSRYVLVIVAHDKIPLLSDTSTGGGLDFLKGFGYSITRPYGTDDHFRLTWRVPGVKAGYTPTVDYTACPIAGYTSLILVNESLEAKNENSSTVDLVRVYDSLPGPELEDESQEKLASIPEAFIATRKTETIRQPVKNDATILSPSGLPTDVNGGILRTELGASGANKLVFDKGQVRVTVTTGPTVDQEYDPLTGKLITVTQELVPAGTAGETIDPLTGEYATIKQINQFYAIKTTRRPTALGVGSDARSYDSIINWAWPPVLLAINFFGVNNKDGSLAKMGYNTDFKEGYSGPCRARITESWSPVAIAAPTITPMIPTPMEFDFPLTNLSIPACLHTQITFTEVIGTNHPTLAYTTSTKTFAGTNYTNWPNTIVGQFTQTPYQGGFRIESVLIYKPG